MLRIVMVPAPEAATPKRYHDAGVVQAAYVWADPQLARIANDCSPSRILGPCPYAPLRRCTASTRPTTTSSNLVDPAARWATARSAVVGVQLREPLRRCHLPQDLILPPPVVGRWQWSFSGDV
jgi:hypothetical protein